jgi:hypothetical protein
MLSAACIALLATQAAAAAAAADYAHWRHSGSVFILTTPDGADLPATASVEGFPLLVRLHRDFFDFRQAKLDGSDLRFSTASGDPLPYEIDEWDPAGGTAAVWVRIPNIKGNARQELKLHWGNDSAGSESNGAAVFDRTNGYLSVWHMNARVADAVGTLTSKDVGTTASAGVIGKARHFAGKQGIFCGDKIPDYPSGAASHSTQAWFRAERPNTTIIGWGNEGGGRGTKIRMQLRSPPHIHVDSAFADVDSDARLPMSEWIHVVHTYEKGAGRIYINGRPAGSSAPTLAIKSPARLWLGGWYDNYDFVGDMDEVRVSGVARSADWVRLEFENQKPLQTLAGPVVRAGGADGTLAVSSAELTVPEGGSATITAQADGAQKLYWVLKRAGRETVVAVDRLKFDFAASRVAADESLTLQLRAVYPDGTRSKDVAVTVKKGIPDPEFTLAAPAAWDGRRTIEVIPTITNLAALRAKGAADLTYRWSVGDIAVIKETAPGKLILHRAQNSGPLTVTLALGNGGPEVVRSVTIAVTEPARDPWVARMPDKDEKPEDNQFYAREDGDEGTLHCNGTLGEAADAVVLRVFADDKPFAEERRKPGADNSYAFAVRLKAGLVKYRIELGAVAAGRETPLHKAGNLVCGDVYLIEGQSNAVATDWGKDEYPFASTWIRSYGSRDIDPKDARLRLWGDATARGRGGRTQIGYWGMELARRLVENRKVPVCIINGAVGGTRIDQHQRNPADPEDVSTIYGRLLWRVRQARLTHGVRGILWHQGENDQGADGPTGGFGWESYRQYFIDMAAGWKRDYPNVGHYYVFQIWPRACAMGIDGSDNRLREVQRTLPTAFSRMSVMSTLGIEPPGGCHYPPAGYAEIARLICPLVERDMYGAAAAASITPPNLRRAYFAEGKRDSIMLEFDQPVKWDDSLAGQFRLDGDAGRVASGTAAGVTVTLRLTAASAAKTVSYLDGRSWSQKTLLRGENGIAALTFCEVPILPAKPGR